MTQAAIKADGERRWALTGRLDFTTVPTLWSELSGKLGAGAVLDLSAVESANSAGLALLLEAHAEAGAKGARVQICGMPESLVQLAAISGLGPFLQELQA